MQKKPRVIVVANQKGGSGKSTLSVHISIGLMKRGLSLALIDADGKQGTLSRFMSNRKNFAKKNNLNLELPDYTTLDPSFDAEHFLTPQLLLDPLMEQYSHKDFILIDTPGTYTPLMHQAHFYADILLTPLNNSYLDLDVLVQMSSGEPRQIEKMSSYSETIFELKKKRIQEKKTTPLKWIVVRNRLSHIKTNNNEQLTRDFESISKRLGFVLSRGLGERVIFRQLFLQGLTVLDTEILGDEGNLSRLAALGEIKEIIDLFLN